MASLVQFETPENVQVAYQPAGLGTRFCAWMLDSVFVTLVTIAATIVGMIVAASLGVVGDNMEKKLGLFDRQGPNQLPLYFMALIVLCWGFGSFLYFTLCELFWRGQTIGKRTCRVRVVKASGFSLDGGSILLRNVFRLIDQLPPLWIVPVLSSRGQRFGDMAAGTVVVAETQDQLSDLRTRLLAIPADHFKFRFDAAKLGRASRSDIEAIERILERWPQLANSHRKELLTRVLEPLSVRLGTPKPEQNDGYQFLEEFLAATYRQEARRLG